LFGKFGYSLEPIDYAICIRICLSHDEYINALDYVFAAGNKGIDFMDSYSNINTPIGGKEAAKDSVKVEDSETEETDDSNVKIDNKAPKPLGLTLQNDFTVLLQKSDKHVDEVMDLFYSLSEQDYRIPLFLVNALIRASGRRYQVIILSLCSIMRLYLYYH
jgi:hypothetical protein